MRERQQKGEEQQQQQQLQRAREWQQQEWLVAVRHRPEDGWAAGAGDAAPAEGAAQPAAELAAELAAAAWITPSQAAAAAAGASVVAGPATESHPSEAAVPRALSEAGAAVATQGEMMLDSSLTRTGFTRKPPSLEETNKALHTRTDLL